MSVSAASPVTPGGSRRSGVGRGAELIAKTDDGGGGEPEHRGDASRFRVPCNALSLLRIVTKPETPRLPTKIGRYDIRAKLADGGMATSTSVGSPGPPGSRSSTPSR